MDLVNFCRSRYFNNLYKNSNVDDKPIFLVFQENIYTFELRRFFALFKMTVMCHTEHSEGSSAFQTGKFFPEL